MKIKQAVAAIAFLMSALATQAGASTVITFSDPLPTGLSLSGSYTLNNTACPGPSQPSVDKPCAELKTLTISADEGYTFDLTSFYYKLSGKNDSILVSYGNPAGSFPIIDNSDGARWTGSILGLSFVTFSGIIGKSSKSNPLLDNIGVNLNVPAVPVPASGLLLIGAIGGLVAMRRKRVAA